MGLKKLHIYIVKTFVPLLLGSFAVAWFIVVMQLLWRFVDDIAGKGVGAMIMLKLMFYAAMTVVPIALVLAVLIGSLMTFGNLGERLELLAMKSAGISLIRIFKPLFFFVAALGIGLFVFQNDLMITSQVKFWQYYFSIKNKSPELAIPSGVFYKDIEGYSIYVEDKDKDTQMLKGVMIYDYKDGFQNAAVITADSGRLYTTNNGNIFVLELYHGESFRNLRENESSYAASNALTPYMRETFSRKEVHIPFDASLDMIDESMLSSQFVGKNMFQLKSYTDSLTVELDSVSLVNQKIILDNSYLNRFRRAGREVTSQTILSTPDPTDLYDATRSTSLGTEETIVPKAPNRYARLDGAEQSRYEMERILNSAGFQARKRIEESARGIVTSKQSELYFSNVTQEEMASLKTKNEFEYWRKFTYPLAVIVFFMIGAPLGSLIRKGGLGVPFIVGVLFFIVFYLLETTGVKMAKDGRWVVWCGMWLPNMVLFPVGVWLNYVATRDSTRLNLDTYTNWIRKVMGLNTNRKVGYKESALRTVDLSMAHEDIIRINELSDTILLHGVQKYYAYFAKESPTVPMRQELDDVLNEIVGNLENARDYLLVHRVGNYPYLHRLAHTYKPKEKWLSILFMIFFPLGLPLYIYYVIRDRAYMKELKALKKTNSQVSEEIERIMSRTTFGG